MKADIWMPLYIGAYLADTMHLNTEQHGAYVLLLMHYWRKGPIPDDDQVLASITRLPVDRWKETRGLLLGFFSVSDGFWNQKRADAEIARAMAFKDKQKANGSKGGRPKNPNKTQQEPKPEPKDNPTESPSPTPTHKSVSPDGDTGDHQPPALTLKTLVELHGVDRLVASDFLKTRKAKRLANTATALNGLLREFGKAGLIPAEGIRICTEKGWGGFNHTWDWKTGGNNATNQPGGRAVGFAATDAIDDQWLAERRGSVPG